jgi:phosphoribosylamine---glycine ligase
LKLLVIGSGGREHALVWKLKQSRLVDKIWCAPGNGGISRDADCVPLDVGDIKAAADLAEKLRADLTVVGPELPLVLGIVDEFTKRGLKILGPTQNAAQLEGSKVFAKRFLERHKIPSATLYGVFNSPVDAYAELCSVDWPLVVKADGLCSGKGVLVTSSPDEATAFIDRVMEQREFGEAGKQILLEEGLAGEELSYIILTDGKDVIPMAPTHDYKRALDNDEGPNTGGMGAYSSPDILPAEVERKIIESVVQPTLAGLRSDGIAYNGFLYFGLMLTADGPKVLEFNCRLGDPETEVIVLRAEFDFAEACLAAAENHVKDIKAAWSPSCAMCVVIASEGYPEKPLTGRKINGLVGGDGRTGVVSFHAGSRLDGSEYYTSGGRVLIIAALGADAASVRRSIYDTASLISIEGAYYRKDIGSGGGAKIASASSVGTKAV